MAVLFFLSYQRTFSWNQMRVSLIVDFYLFIKSQNRLNRQNWYECRKAKLHGDRTKFSCLKSFCAEVEISVQMLVRQESSRPGLSSLLRRWSPARPTPPPSHPGPPPGGRGAAHTAWAAAESRSSGGWGCGAQPQSWRRHAPRENGSKYCDTLTRLLKINEKDATSKMNSRCDNGSVLYHTSGRGFSSPFAHTSARVSRNGGRLSTAWGGLRWGIAQLPGRWRAESKQLFILACRKGNAMAHSSSRWALQHDIFSSRLLLMDCFFRTVHLLGDDNAVVPQIFLFNKLSINLRFAFLSLTFARSHMSVKDVWRLFLAFAVLRFNHLVP